MPDSEAITSAAEQIAYLLKKYNKAGTVWYRHSARVFRIAGVGYNPWPGEECCGVYLPDITIKALAEDLEYVLREARKAA